MQTPIIHVWFDKPTNTITYLVADPATRKAAVVDPVFDYDHKSGKADVASVEAVLAKAASEGYGIDWVLETHVHADHLSGAPYIKLKTGAKLLSTTIRADMKEGDIGGPLATLAKEHPDTMIGSYPYWDENGQPNTNLIVRSRSETTMNAAADAVRSMLAALKAR